MASTPHRRGGPARPNRRELLKTAAAAAAGAGFWVATRDGVLWSAEEVKSPNAKLNVGVIGVAGRGGDDLNEVAAIPAVNVVALCDVDDHRLGPKAEKFPMARKYNDFRKMLEEGKDLDAVVVGTPDHIHVPAALMAVNLGKHVYCEKPLAHNVYEARLVTEAAKKNKRVTQLGTQIHAGKNYRRVVELIRAGAVGPVREAHVFCGKVWSPENDPPVEKVPVPAGLNFDLWLGPATERPYTTNLLPANWRKWFDFGSGTLGDMGCHYMDLPFWALELKYPTRASAEGPRCKYEGGTPPWVVVQWDFPEREGVAGGDGMKLPPVKLFWYDGDKRPAKLAEWGLANAKDAAGNPKEDWANGVVFVGDKGLLAADYGRHVLLPEKDFADYKRPEPSIPPSVGHHNEWVRACLDNNPAAASCRFEYSGPLSETVLLGTVAHRAGKPIEWDAANLKATNAPEAEKYVRREYRKGWEL